MGRGQGEDMSGSKIPYVITQHGDNRRGSSVKLDNLLVSRLLTVQENAIRVKMSRRTATRANSIHSY